MMMTMNSLPFKHFGLTKAENFHFLWLEDYTESPYSILSWTIVAGKSACPWRPTVASLCRSMRTSEQNKWRFPELHGHSNKMVWRKER